MSTRKAPELARNAKQTIKQIRQGAMAPGGAAAVPTVRKPRYKVKTEPSNPDHGRQIWVYSHLQKNHVVYSMTKALSNHASLAQLPYNGKKTVPPALRKDLWHPFATIHFSSPDAGSIGRSAFQKLREYRKRHELEWDESMFLTDKGDFVEKKKRGRLLCDQRANSVADMAAVLSRLAVKEVVDTEGEGKVKGGIGLTGEGTGEKVLVKWRDLKDAEWAETWGENVEHGILEMHTNHRDVDRKRIGLKTVPKKTEPSVEIKEPVAV